MSMLSEQYVWLVWSSVFLVPWLAAFAAFPRHRKAMLWASLFTTPFGLTEPLFVPEYWSPPSLFDLACITGFDIRVSSSALASAASALSFTISSHAGVTATAKLTRLPTES
jgi:hypothetical protein